MAAILPRPWNISYTLSDEDAIRGIELMTDDYNAIQRESNPAHVDVTPQLYFRTRVLNWCQRERRMKDPATTTDPDILRRYINSIAP